MKKIFTPLILLLCISFFSLAQTVSVNGRRILVNNTTYNIRGVCYSPHAIGAPEWIPDFSKVSQDIQLMLQANINTIRTYRPIPEKSVLDAFGNAGIKVIIGFTLEETQNGAYANYINTYKNHPAILMWVFGNEFNYHPEWFSNNMNNWYSLLNTVAGNARSLDPNHPIATVHGELPTATVINSCPNVQVWGLNIYRGDTHEPLYTDWSNRSTKPMFIAETGADSYPDPQAPAIAIPRIYNSLSPHLTTATGGITSGVCWFSWTDEWWKSGNNSVQDTGGFPNGGVPYDGFANEEYWGVLDINRNPKPAYNALKNIFVVNTPGVATFYKNCSYGGTAVSLPLGDYTLAQLTAKGILNNDISSVKVNTGYRVLLFDTENLTGTSLAVTTDVSCLVADGWNDKTSSMRITTSTCTPTSLTPQIRVNGGALQQTNAASLAAGGSVVLSPLPSTGGTWSWSGPNSFTSTAREITISNIQSSQAGNYVATHTNAAGCKSNLTFTISLSSGAFTRTIQAESYNYMLGIQTETTTDAGGGSNVGWIDAGDWMSYTNIIIPSTGSYRIEYRVASPAGGRLTLDMNGGTTVLGSVNIPATGGWQTWTTVSHIVPLNAGTFSFGIVAATGGWNINWWRITSSTAARLDTEENVVAEGIKLLPNPTTEIIEVLSSKTLAGEKVSIVDARGVEKRFTLTRGNLVNVSTLSPGVYTLNILVEGKRKSYKFIKQ